ncbi:cytochrome P450 [Aspergillus pseudocaelatus]|uniref:Cytochrome P450 n=1 Tax=Aspergillus pseudocaelatus TaxID=1825620 RepID=A0ABQ6X054_9EURO|nr:cytochrome P450 [Aspergillus pseudocaelatus]
MMNAVWIAVGFLAIVLLARGLKASQRDAKMPPGPPGLPLLGNLHELPWSKSYLKMLEWSRKYGDIYSLKLGSTNVIVLSSADVVTELFDKRGAIYSNRPDSYIANELLCPNETHLLLMSYGPAWRHLRKTFMSVLNISTVQTLRTLQGIEASQTMKDLCDTPESFSQHIRRYATGVILSSVFGTRAESFDDPNVKEIYRVQDQFSEILEPGNTPPVDAFPWLQYLPSSLASWKQRAAEVYKGQHDLYHGLLNGTKRRIANAGYVNCFMDRLLSDEEKAKHNLDDEHLAFLGGVMMEAGSDSTSSTLLSFILAMVKYPHVLKKLQAEIDAVCGDERSPTFEDMPSLPYVQACVLETMRWRPAVPAAFPHVLTQDDWYRGYFLPKGSMVIANVTAIHQNPNDYEDPSQYMPERYYKNEHGLKPGRVADPARRSVYTFGAGRRVCPGMHLGENSLRINMARLAWGFDFLPPLDSVTGKEAPREQIQVDVKSAYTDGVSSGPKDYKCRIVPRSRKHVEIMRKDLELAGPEIDQYRKQ